MGFDSVLSGAKKLLKGDKAIKALFIVGILGIALIFLSTFTGKKPKEAAESKADGAYTSEAYCEMLEKKLGSIVTDITGSENARVFVTLESGAEYVYANEVKQGTDKVEDQKGEDSKKVQQKDSTEQNYILVEGEDGRKTALLVTELAPKVQGVTVVCDKGNQEAVAEKITDAITTALHITSRRVCVTGRAS